MDNMGLFLANKLKCIDVPAPKYELIETISISESDIFTISRTEEPNGDAYNFDKIIVKINNGTTSLDNANIKIQGSGLTRAIFENAITTDPGGGAYMFYEADVSEGIKKIRYSSVEHSGSRCNIYSRHDSLTITNSKITSLSITSSSSTVAFPVGLEIEIYAVRC